MRVRLDVSYDGTEFSGWARQPQRRTVQDVLERALATVLRLPSVQLRVAGRTDAGVHATGQVAHCDLPSLPGGLERRLAGILPPDVRVQAVQAVPPAFDARFAALWRRYVYRVCDAPSGVAPLLRREVLAWPRALDVAAMRGACARLIGLHDFAAYCRHREGTSTIRTLQQLSLERHDAEIVITAVADAFCQSMVRSLVGALLAVGDGRRGADWPASLLGIDRRADDVVVAPPHGLTLVEVGYPPDDGLATRVEQARARRT